MELKIIILVVLLSVTNIYATNAYSQTAKVTLDAEDISLEQVMDEIEQQSEFYFVFNQKQINVARVVNIQAENKLINDILPELFRGTDIKYAILDRKILLTTDPVGIEALDLYKPQQQLNVTGVVTDASTGDPMPGVNIQIKGTIIGTISDSEGKYSINVTDRNVTLIFSFIGYVTREITSNGRVNIDVALEGEVTGLDEVVVIGYGTSRRGNITGSIGSIKVDDALSSRPSADFGSTMFGKIAGVKIQSSSGTPGESSRIQIRGINSISAGVMPLVVVDGIVLPDYTLNTINSSDIESIEVLKDAASAAIYGSRGSNGVILVKTKHGGGLGQNRRVTFNYTFSIQEQMRYIKMMDGPQYAQAAIDCAQHGWIDSGGDPEAPNTIEARKLYKYTWPEALEHPETLWSTDFQRLITRVAPMHKADMNISGGDEHTRYMLSVGFVDQTGIIQTSDFKRINLNLKADSKINKWLTVGGLVNVSKNNDNLIDMQDVNATISAAREYPPIYPVYGNNGYLGGPMSVDGFANYYNILNRDDNEGHPLWHLYGFDEVSQGFNTISSIFAEIEIIPNLKFRSAYNVAYRRTDHRRFEKNDRGVAKLYRARMTSDMNRIFNYTSENLLTYANSWSNHTIDAVFGYEFNHREYYSLSGTRVEFDNDLIPYLAGGNTINNATDNANASALISFLGRLNYNYLKKYMFSASFRRDGSSRFGPENKWGNFPSFSAGWRINEEEFMKDLESISNLTIRASLGFTGNENIGNYAWISSMSKQRVALGNNLISSYYPSSIQNENLAWERSRQGNIGIDIGILKNRFSLTVELYKSKSDGLLLNVPVPTTTGFSSVLRNIGAIETKGIELSLVSHNLTGALKWTTEGTLTRNRSLVTKLGQDDAPMYLNRVNMGIINEVGQTPFSFYAYKYDGVYMNQDEIDAHDVEYTFAVKPGMGRYVDVSKDGLINASDRTNLGSSEPDFFWSLSNNFNYKNFNLSFQFHGVVGGLIYAAQKRRSVFNHEGRNYFAYLAEGAWRSEEEPGDGYHYKLSVDIRGLEKQPSSYWLEDGTYTRLKNINLSYTLPEKYAQRLGLADIRVFFDGTNMFTFQKSESVADPENSSASQTDPATIGIQFNPYPTARTYSFGINVNF